MLTDEHLDTKRFFVAGINYKKTNAAMRGRFAISNIQYAALLQKAPLFGINEMFVISTCNRTEIYGLAQCANDLIGLLCTETEGSFESFCELAYIKNAAPAVEHLFCVAAGLDSQILGDYEIVGQLKAAVKFSKERGFIEVFTERLVNSVLQSSKNIKTHTALSSGIVSVSFAAVQYIRNHWPVITGKNILLIGTGKMGRNTCKNLVDYLNAENITLINRTPGKAADLALELGLRTAPFEDLAACIEKASVILVATHSSEALVLRSHLEYTGNKLVIDMSIPCNVDEEVRNLPNISLVNVDDLSKTKDETLQRREAELPKAKNIIAKHIGEFNEWLELRKYVPVLTAVKTKLHEMHSCDLFMHYSSRNDIPFLEIKERGKQIQQVINTTAAKIRSRNQGGCNFIEAINGYLEVLNN